MNTLGTTSAQYDAPMVSGPNGPPAPPVPKRRKSIFGKVVWLLLLGGAAGGAYYVYSAGMDRVHRDVDWALDYVRKSESESESSPVTKPKERKPYPHWDGLVKLDLDEAKNLGLLVAHGPAAGRADQVRAAGSHRLRPQLIEQGPAPL